MPEATLGSRSLVIQDHDSVARSRGTGSWLRIHLVLAACWFAAIIGIGIHIGWLGNADLQIRRQRGAVGVELRSLTDQQQRLSAHLDIMTSRGRMRQLVAEAYLPNPPSAWQETLRD